MSKACIDMVTVDDRYGLGMVRKKFQKNNKNVENSSDQC